MIRFLAAVPARAAGLVIVLAAVLGACSPDVLPSAAPPGGTVPSLQSTAWIVVTVNGRSPIPGAVPTLQFNASQVTGNGGCNQFGGGYRLDPATGAFAVDQLGSTAIGCVRAGVGEFEGALLTALGGTTRASLDDSGRLLLDGPRSRIVLVTLEHPAAP